MDIQRQELFKALSKLYNGGKYSDLTVKCGSRQWPVHRAILCARSSFFDGACSHRLRETESGVIELDDDDVDAVDQMLYYFYHNDYLVSSSTLELESSPSPPLSPALIDDPHQRHDPLFMQAAARLSPHKLTSCISTPPADHTVGLYPAPFGAVGGHAHVTRETHSRPSDSRTSLVEQDSSDPANSHLILHTRVYALAEKYDVGGLKSLARDKFEVAMACFYDSPEFADALEEVYSSTIESDRGLRSVVLQCFRSHPRLATTTDVHAVIKNTPSLAYDLWKLERGVPV